MAKINAMNLPCPQMFTEASQNYGYVTQRIYCWLNQTRNLTSNSSGSYDRTSPTFEEVTFMHNALLSPTHSVHKITRTKIPPPPIRPPFTYVQTKARKSAPYVKVRLAFRGSSFRPIMDRTAQLETGIKYQLDLASCRVAT